MTSNVLPFFWNLASSSKDTRLSASADLISSLESFQQSYQATRTGEEGDGSVDEEDEDEDSDEESGTEVDGSEDEGQGDDGQGRKLDKRLARDNAEDVTYSVKRLVRGLASSRESSRLGFAVALTELLSRITTVTSAQLLSLLVRSSAHSNSMRGAEERDALFARLFGLTAISQSGSLFSPSSSLSTFGEMVDQLLELSQAKGWLRESAWWTLLGAVNGLLTSNVTWKEDGVTVLVDRVFGDKSWNQEKVALALTLERSRPALDWKTLLAPTFKQRSLLSNGNLATLGRLLKESDASDEDEEGVTASASTGSWKPQLHFVWDSILDTYFPSPNTATTSIKGTAPFQDFFRVVVDESLFSNASSSERKYWGFSVLSRALPLVPSTDLPFLFTPNVMRCWINNLSSSDRYLHKAALNLAKQVQDAVKSNPAVGFTLLSTFVGKGGRMDFDKVTKTKTVEGILGNLSVEGVKDYVTYLQGVVFGSEEKNGTASTGLEERRLWAFDQLLGLLRNRSVPKDDACISSALEFLLVHSFFVIRKTDKKSDFKALHHTPKPPLSETAAANCRSRFFSCVVEVMTAVPTSNKNQSAPPTRRQGCDESGRFWIRRMVDVLTSLEGDKKHVDLMLDADEEIKKLRKSALNTITTLDNITGDQAEISRGVEILLSFTLLQTYDESEDALEMLEEVDSATKRIFNLSSKSSTKAAGIVEGDVPPIDQLLDVLVALLDKGSNDLRNLANLIVGMVAAAFTPSSIEHLVAQLQQTTAEAAADDGEDAVEDLLDMSDQADNDSDAGSDNSDEDDEEDDTSSMSSFEDELDDDEDDAHAKVDPAFRQRVVEVLQISGMAVDGADEMDGESGPDSDEEEDDEVWDDEQMLKVDEQLAEVFRQRANAGKKADFKHLHIENVHFKSRILDFFDVFARKQSSNPLIIHILIPLLRLVQSTSSNETDLSAKTASILKSRIGKARDVPTTADPTFAGEVLETIHTLARHAPSSDFSAMCSICSLFVVRTLDASSPTNTIVIETYRTTLNDYMVRKASLIHPPFIIDLLKRFPARSFPLVHDLLGHADPTSGDKVKVYRQIQAYIMLSTLTSQLFTVHKSLGPEVVRTFVKPSSSVIYSTLEIATTGEKVGWNAARMKDVVKFGLHLARTSKNVLGGDDDVAWEGLWDIERLDKVIKGLKQGEKTGEMKGVQGLLTQLVAVLGSAKQEEEKQKKGGKEKIRQGKGEEGMDMDMEVDVGVDEVVVATSKGSGKDKQKVKKNKSSTTIEQPKSSTNTSATANTSTDVKAKKRKGDGVKEKGEKRKRPNQ